MSPDDQHESRSGWQRLAGGKINKKVLLGEDQFSASCFLQTVFLSLVKDPGIAVAIQQMTAEPGIV